MRFTLFSLLLVFCIGMLAAGTQASPVRPQRCQGASNQQAGYGQQSYGQQSGHDQQSGYGQQAGHYGSYQRMEKRGGGRDKFGDRFKWAESCESLREKTGAFIKGEGYDGSGWGTSSSSPGTSKTFKEKCEDAAEACKKAAKATVKAPVKAVKAVVKKAKGDD